VKSHPVIRGGFAPRFASLIFGLFLFALAIVLTLESDLGLWPWDVLHQGIAHHTPLSFGGANIAVGLVILLVAWALGGKPGIGTIANATLVGLFIVGLSSIDALERLSDEPLGVRIGLLAVGIAIVGPASAFYIGANLGAGPRDTLMLVGSRRTGIRVGIVRATIEVAALAIGIALGGKFGVGTIAFAVAVGPAVEGGFWALEHSPLAAVSPEPAEVIEGY
jgi:uncharacterized membrane protein YczE